MWEFPGGKVLPGEDDSTALLRELAEELGVGAVMGERIGSSQQGSLLLVCYRVRLLGDPIALFHDSLAWVSGPDLHGIPMPPADIEVLGELLPRREQIPDGNGLT